MGTLWRVKGGVIHHSGIAGRPSQGSHLRRSDSGVYFLLFSFTFNVPCCAFLSTENHISVLSLTLQ